MPSIPFLNKLPWVKSPLVIPVVRLQGVIGEGGRLRQGLSIASTAGLLHKAFSMPGPAVALSINSPGGSPAQSDLIGRRIRALAQEKEKTVYAFAEDVAASGGYWLAVAADEVYALETSIVGSIGVVSGGFGFTGLIEKLGVERRLYTAGEAKARLDPFSPEKADDVKWLAALHRDMHAIFKETVKARRGERLKATQKKTFSGDVWLGREALEMGLIDGIGDVKGVMTEKFGKDVKLKLIEAKTGMVSRLLGRARGGPPAGWAEEAIAALEARALWSRFGL
jgi:signal peptide peptidase SppA